jgi:phage baseplate assembly protein W
MPVERVSKAFKDTSLSFQVNPLNKDLIALKNETAISRSVKNLVLTNRGERFFDPFYGSRIKKLLFENMDEITAKYLEDEIKFVINNYEPRVSLNFVEVTPNYDINQFDVLIDYRIVGIDATSQELSFALLPTR